LFSLLLLRQICNFLYRDRASTRNKTLCTLTCYLLPINLVPRHSYNSQNLYPDGKNRAPACASLQRGRLPLLAPHDAHFQLGQGPRRDSLSAKVPSRVLGTARMLRRVTLTKFYRRAVIRHWNPCSD